MTTGKCHKIRFFMTSTEGRLGCITPQSLLSQIKLEIISQSPSKIITKQLEFKVMKLTYLVFRRVPVDLFKYWNIIWPCNHFSPGTNAINNFSIAEFHAKLGTNWKRLTVHHFYFMLPFLSK